MSGSGPGSTTRSRVEIERHAPAAAREALRRGWSPVPIPAGEKNPGFKSWQEFKSREERVEADFPASGNLGLLLGAPSGNLIDVDLDCAEALRLAPRLLPRTGLIHGRPGRPRSHYWYVSDASGRLEPFRDPTTNATLVELRGQGGQTVIPPSVHPSGERLEWASYGDPAPIPLADLRRAVSQLAACALLAKHYPDRTRHAFTLALAGCLMRHGLHASQVEELLVAVAEAVGPDASRLEDLAHIRRNVASTAERLAQGAPSTGGNALKEYLDEKVLSKLISWLELASDSRSDAITGQPEVDAPVGANERVNDPHRIARLFLAARFSHAERTTLVFFREEFYRWAVTRYERIAEAGFRGEIAQFAKSFFDEKNQEAVAAWEANGGVDPETGKQTRKPTCLPVTVSLVSNIRQALTGMVGTELEPPAWLADDGSRPLAGEIVSFSNELVHLPAWVSGDGAFAYPHSPAFFTLHSMDFAFDADAPEPVVWRVFLRQLWPQDEESVRELQKWFGYCLTADTSQQKILMLIGPPRSGKGTIARVLTGLLGPSAVAGPTLSSFSTNFGLWPLLGKRLAIISDARITGRTDAAPVIERLLSISGEDSLTVDRKNLPPVSTKLDARLMLLSNELPRLGDSSTALSSRMLVLSLGKSFLGEEDPGLTAALLEELPGILIHFALPGLRMLREDGRFRQPASGRELVEELEALSSPILAFVRERCVLDPSAGVPVQALFEEWLRWCETVHRENAGDCQTFGRNLRAAIPGLRVDRPRRGGERVRLYEGIRLRLPGEEWSAMVRGHFNSTRGEAEGLSESKVEGAIERTADHRGPPAAAGPAHPCVTCGKAVDPELLYCSSCWAERRRRKDLSK